MSGSFTQADRERAGRLGCAIFERPFDMVALAALVEAVERSVPLECVPLRLDGVESPLEAAFFKLMPPMRRRGSA
jgi:hypothetical protein